MEETMQSRHRKEIKELQNRITQKKKQASKKTRKGVNDECDRLEAELKLQQTAELTALDGNITDHHEDDRRHSHIKERDEDDRRHSHIKEHDEDAGRHSHIKEHDEDAGRHSHIREHDEDDGKHHDVGTVALKNLTLREDELKQETQDTQQTDQLATDDSAPLVPSQIRKPNRQKARMAKRAAHQEEIARQAAEEAEDLPDMKQQERDRMLDSMKERSLQEKEIRADGHCLYSAVADQLTQLGIPLDVNPTEQPVVPYQLTRRAAADYIAKHGDDFAGFLEEPLPEYVHKIRETAEWGGQLELQALAKVYGVQINVLQDFGRVEKIEPDSAESKTIWLGYYKHGFGLGEHYNSLRKRK